MARAEFLWVESPATAMDEKPLLQRVRFGDGYEQRAPAGLNPLEQQWSVVLRDVENSVGDAVIAFLRARLTAQGGLESFDWQPLWGNGLKIAVIAPSWQRTHSDTWGECHISIKFEQVFEPSLV